MPITHTHMPASAPVFQKDTSVRETRKCAGGTLRAWGLPPTAAADALPVLTGLVTNALIHTTGEVGLELTTGTDERGVPVVEIAAVDEAAVDIPAPRPGPGGIGESGRGLQIVYAPPTAHGRETTATPAGIRKRVWAQLRPGSATLWAVAA